MHCCQCDVLNSSFLNGNSFYIAKNGFRICQYLSLVFYHAIILYSRNRTGYEFNHRDNKFILNIKRFTFFFSAKLSKHYRLLRTIIFFFSL